MEQLQRRQHRARWAGRGWALLAILLCGAADARAPREKRRSGEEKIERKAHKDGERLEKREAKLRKHEAYEAGRREALAEAQGQCADPGQARGRLTMAGGGLVGDWRVSPLYAGPRARRIYVNGYNSCLRGHDLDPRYRGDLPVEPPEAPLAEEALPALGEDEKAYLEANSGRLWEDGAKRCEQDLKDRVARR